MIGIMLATALMTAVVTMAVSFQKSLVSYEKKKSGDFHYAFLQQDQELMEKIKANRNIESYYETVGIGYANLEGCTNEDKPYVFVEAMDEKALERSSVQLEEGRMPKNDSELLISKTIFTNGGVEWNVGDKVTLSVGKRVYDGEENYDNFKKGALLGQESGYLVDEDKVEPKFEKTYTIVGVTKRLSYGEEDYSAPGYTVITYMGQKEQEDFDARVSPIVALRRNKDIKLTAKKIRTPKWISAMFGVSLDELTEEDLKNFSDIEEREDVKAVTISRVSYLQFDKKHALVQLLMCIQLGMKQPTYVLYDRLGGMIEMGYHYPWTGVLIAIAAVALLLGGIMQYSLAQIRKQNIIETLRQDNV